MSRLFINSATKTTKQFKVIIVDNPPYFEGRQMADELQSKGINNINNKIKI
jgi:translation initiation factor 2B subunit (eIF-2B alpha/beta/delta family)